MGSTRLPGKVLAQVVGRPLLWHVVTRLRCSERLDGLILATSTLQRDDVLERFAADLDLSCFRGSESDVLSRYYQAATQWGGDVIVRVTGDCPLIDPKVVDSVIDVHLGSGADYTSNTLVRTYPRGLDTEVFTYKVLATAYRAAEENYEREHVTPYIWRHHKLFHLQSVEAEGKLRKPELRLTVDTEEDLSLIRSIYEALYPSDQLFDTEKVIDFLDKEPELTQLNKYV
jgi:spore coat polysaccharide biosynthesis protein SpsF